jgi:mono/diheme cytochrome c family protein
VQSTIALLDIMTERVGTPRMRLAALTILVAGTIPAMAAEPPAVFDLHCALCHQKAAVGLHGQFPRLAGRIGSIAASAPGRLYLQEVLLYGMAGRIQVDGTEIVGVMPAFANLPDEDLANVANYLLQLSPVASGDKRIAPFTAEELQRTRGQTALTPNQVHEVRAGVVDAPKNTRATK